MTINSVMNTGLQGMNTSYSAIERAADKITRVQTDDSAPSSGGVVNSLSLDRAAGAAAGNSQGATLNTYEIGSSQQSLATRGNTQENIIDPIVEMKVQQHVFDASAKVVKSADEMLGTIMDIKA